MSKEIKSICGSWEILLDVVKRGDFVSSYKAFYVRDRPVGWIIIRDS